MSAVIVASPKSQVLSSSSQQHRNHRSENWDISCQEVSQRVVMALICQCVSEKRKCRGLDNDEEKNNSTTALPVKGIKGRLLLEAGDNRLERLQTEGFTHSSRPSIDSSPGPTGSREAVLYYLLEAGPLQNEPGVSLFGNTSTTTLQTGHKDDDMTAPNQDELVWIAPCRNEAIVSGLRQLRTLTPNVQDGSIPTRDS
ncbi:unnamed protein product [Pleuronectes platessa]|uniref:Uncharacterized protein n=1 Tax=Pleuronectes platessa TaxID=8262 RepID=A0A9N7Y501_PLEPL|nr:unnamed protein product [Pleuronectes platessa]